MYSSAKKENEIQEQQRVVQQLQRESKCERIKVSRCATDLMQYCTENQTQDPLIIKIPANDNPFRERRSTCAIL
ncbi:guanine nucleotide-binding protein G(I)/G(S)/G(O) subunit gamma-12 [Exaiptasia diaphana]|uniref:Guanine nucleotide-binding protein subunit gamma n=1 Tax=Exaiptasia diaphana TaxID=2652724 RepID=A0A913XIX0_EXADI|nr:guanine nucleotide-binding protein G(I)/G(S)/G(O) subunit gamma-12 [Exaiptasia diaphana]KXJ11767.1 Guanine nucleotide-binding protein G(I)/G(S)/G(O) subunit gamma-12 [Exaiptasia diaphana]